MTGEGKVLLGIGVVTLALFIGGILSLSKKSLTVDKPVDPAVLIREDSQKMVGANSKVTLVEFGDYQCPFCSQAHASLKELLAAHADEMTFVFRDFPLLQHPNSQIAAEAAQAAGAQGKYWEMYDLLYENQSEWSGVKDPLPIFAKYADQLKLSADQFSQALKDRTYRAKVQAGLADGNLLGVNSTPTFYVDNQKFDGSMDDLKTLIESKLTPAK